MKAITISQPYASLIADGVKWVENRTWPTGHRGPIAIHAGKGTQYLSRAEIESRRLPFGQIVATANLVACITLRNLQSGAIAYPLPGGHTREELLEHEHTEGPWLWLLADVVKFDTPVEAIGKLGLWEWNQ